MPVPSWWPAASPKHRVTKAESKTEAERKRTATIVCKDDCLFATLSRAAYLKVMDNLEEQAYAALRKEPERRTKSDLSLLCSFFAELAFFKELHFPLLQAAVLAALLLRLARLA